MENIYLSDKRPDSNFDGNWDELCTYCGRPHRDHIWKENLDPNYTHRIPCQEQSEFMMSEHRKIVRTGKAIVFIGWILIPLFIAIVGFASFWVGLLLFIISLFKIGWKAIELYGKPEKWSPGYRERKERERKMAHYFHHCEKNPQGFLKLKAENFEKENGDGDAPKNAKLPISDTAKKPDREEYSAALEKRPAGSWRDLPPMVSLPSGHTRESKPKQDAIAPPQ